MTTQSNVKSSSETLTPDLVGKLLDRDLQPYQKEFLDTLAAAVIGIDLASGPEGCVEAIVYEHNGKVGHVIVDEYFVDHGVRVPGRRGGKTFWITRRMEAFAEAERYLKARGILVSVVDRDAWVRTYRVTGYRSPVYLEQVVALAQYLGFEAPGE